MNFDKNNHDNINNDSVDVFNIMDSSSLSKRLKSNKENSNWKKQDSADNSNKNMLSKNETVIIAIVHGYPIVLAKQLQDNNYTNNNSNSNNTNNNIGCNDCDMDDVVLEDIDEINMNIDLNVDINSDN